MKYFDYYFKFEKSDVLPGLWPYMKHFKLHVSGENKLAAPVLNIVWVGGVGQGFVK